LITLSLGEPQHPVPSFVGLFWQNTSPSSAAIRWPRVSSRSARRQTGFQPDSACRGGRSRNRNPGAERQPRGLFFAAITAARYVGERRGRPAILMPNPFYPAYGAGARAAGCEQIYLPTTVANGFLPDLDALDEATLPGRCGLHRLAGQSAKLGRLARLFHPPEETGRSLRIHDSERRVLFGNLHQGSAGPRWNAPDRLQQRGGVSIALKAFQPAGHARRFAAGDREFLAAFHELRNVPAPRVPMPLQHVAVAAYSDEAHVEENRKLYRIKFDLADQILR
jgi:hypothetical protein